MKFLTLRTLSALSLAALLAACGGPQDELPTQSAASIQTGSATTSVHVSAAAGSGSTGAATGSAAAGSTAVPTASATMPQPDCAADGCNGPRIIDANAEAWRYAAMQRAAADVSQS
ncbi:hypothetical protein [Herbaspirillum sp. SJZ107]|uniref:hypothetical protein n=1 Tax=Herbaspirillum sp. SJZ107 TaxID=2572881 RepID=UPI0011533334|nr:hypothetical protein [Herbaspirillum sp. SJZ107]TQK10550.1 hypothetical protein FBX97_0468 [Herbaspirillum sp. SJZ107]